MGPIPVIAEIYMLCAGFGTLFVIFTAAMGASHGQQGGHALTGGHHALTGGHTATGAHGHAHTGAHGVTGGQAAAHTHGGDGTHSGHGHGNGQAGHRTGQGQHNTKSLAPQTVQSTLPAHQTSNEKLALAVLTFCNPTFICVFLSMFGAFGLILWRLTPVAIEWTLPAAVACALVTTKIIMALMARMMRSMYASKTYTMDSVIGSIAEVTVGVNNGRMGEIMYTVGVRRYTASAKSADANDAFKRGDNVVIVDVVDDVAIISPFNTELDFVQ